MIQKTPRHDYRMSTEERRDGMPTRKPNSSRLLESILTILVCKTTTLLYFMIVRLVIHQERRN